MQSNTSSPPPPRGAARGNPARRFGAALAGLALLGGLLWAWGAFDADPAPPPAPADTPPEPDTFPLVPISASPFRNTGPDARYVGSAGCTACHKERAASFRRTGMGVSMAVVDPAAEPPDAEFHHAKSGHRYQVVRRDGGLWHRESSAAGVLLSEHRLTHAVGSGNHAKSYLAVADGFLIESPVTWYSSGRAWDMSPGYDRPTHLGFMRSIGENCLYCHAGRAEAVGGSTHRMSIPEPAIGCERCHGPGSLHTEFRASGPALAAGQFDDTIVNPRRLSRDLVEAVCAQCHFHSAAMVVARGRRLTDFRPGLPLEDFRIEHRLEADNAPMKVTGHVGEMRLSRCYTQSATLTCTTCHDPHAFPEPARRVQHYKAACATCHTDDHCKVDRGRLRRESPENDCVRCHMPKAPTDVPHTSFTHHRIAVHDRLPPPNADSGRAGVLRPWKDDPRLGDADRQRALGLAYLELATEDTTSPVSVAYKQTGYRLLAGVRAAGLRDPVVESRLARLEFERNNPAADGLAAGVLANPDAAPAERCEALFIVGAERLRRGQFREALDPLRELTTLRRHPDDWLLIAECERTLGNPAARDAAFEKAVTINPRIKLKR